MFSFHLVPLLAFLLHSFVHSIPLDARQATQVSSVTTAVFPTATCVITLSPKKDAQGRIIEVVEVEVCVAEKDPLSSEGSSTRITSTSLSSATPSTTTTTITVTVSPPTSSTSPPTSSTSPLTSSTSPPTSSSSPPTSSSSPPVISPSPPTINAISPSPIPSPSSTTSSVPLPSVVAGGLPLPGDANLPTTSTIETSSIFAQPSAAGVSAVESSMPGKKLSVLPIGLGVFAGISVIALIVVGLVTYERTKYRKAFRQRKLAEAGAPMGYSGREY